jgi:hypothetical protein
MADKQDRASRLALPHEGIGMNTKGIFFSGERGFHLLFDTAVIAEAFEQDAEELQQIAETRMDEVESVLAELFSLPTLRDGRAFIRGLPRALQHVLVLLYFEILEARLRRSQTLH